MKNRLRKVVLVGLISSLAICTVGCGEADVLNKTNKELAQIENKKFDSVYSEEIEAIDFAKKFYTSWFEMNNVEEGKDTTANGSIEGDFANFKYGDYKILNSKGGYIKNVDSFYEDFASLKYTDTPNSFSESVLRTSTVTLEYATIESFDYMEILKETKNTITLGTIFTYSDTTEDKKKEKYYGVLVLQKDKVEVEEGNTTKETTKLGVLQINTYAPLDGLTSEKDKEFLKSFETLLSGEGLSYYIYIIEEVEALVKTDLSSVKTEIATDQTELEGAIVENSDVVPTEVTDKVVATTEAETTEEEVKSTTESDTSPSTKEDTETSIEEEPVNQAVVLFEAKVKARQDELKDTPVLLDVYNIYANQILTSLQSGTPNDYTAILKEVGEYFGVEITKDENSNYNVTPTDIQIPMYPLLGGYKSELSENDILLGRDDTNSIDAVRYNTDIFHYGYDTCLDYANPVFQGSVQGVLNYGEGNAICIKEGFVLVSSNLLKDTKETKLTDTEGNEYKILGVVTENKSLDLTVLKIEDTKLQPVTFTTDITYCKQYNMNDNIMKVGKVVSTSDYTTLVAIPNLSSGDVVISTDNKIVCYVCSPKKGCINNTRGINQGVVTEFVKSIEQVKAEKLVTISLDSYLTQLRG